MPAALVNSKRQYFFHCYFNCIWIGVASQLEFMLPYSLIRILILFVLIVRFIVWSTFDLLYFCDIGCLGYCRMIVWSIVSSTFTRLLNNVTFGSPSGTLNGFIHVTVKCLISPYLDGHFTSIQLRKNILYLSASCPNTISMSVKCSISPYLDGHFTLTRLHISVDPDLVLREWRHFVLIRSVEIITWNANTKTNKI